MLSFHLHFHDTIFFHKFMLQFAVCCSFGFHSLVPLCIYISLFITIIIVIHWIFLRYYIRISYFSLRTLWSIIHPQVFQYVPAQEQGLCGVRHPPPHSILHLLRDKWFRDEKRMLDFVEFWVREFSFIDVGAEGRERDVVMTFLFCACLSCLGLFF